MVAEIYEKNLIELVMVVEKTKGPIVARYFNKQTPIISSTRSLHHEAYPQHKQRIIVSH